MQTAEVNRYGSSFGILLDQDGSISCGAVRIEPHPDRDTLHSGGILECCNIEGGYWDSEIENLDESFLLLRVNTRGREKRDSWIHTDCQRTIKDRCKGKLREDPWVVALCWMEPGDQVTYQAPWRREPEKISWTGDHEINRMAA